MGRSHLMTNTRMYSVWKTMRTRCNNPNHQDYKYYGGRGIKVCKEWDDFSKFYNWAMANGYSDDLTIDRIDVNKNYEPSNCRWVTMRNQCRNKRNTVYGIYKGERKPLIEISEITGISLYTLHAAVKKSHITDFTNFKPQHADEKYINKKGNGYQLIYKSKYIGRYKTLEEAVKVRDSLIAKEVQNGVT